MRQASYAVSLQMQLPSSETQQILITPLQGLVLACCSPWLCMARNVATASLMPSVSTWWHRTTCHEGCPQNSSNLACACTGGAGAFVGLGTNGAGVLRSKPQSNPAKNGWRFTSSAPARLPNRLAGSRSSSFVMRSCAKMDQTSLQSKTQYVDSALHDIGQ